MNTIRLTAEHFKDTGKWFKEYCGEVDVTNYDGHIEIDGGLGWVGFASLKASGRIAAGAGSGIEAGWGIEAKLVLKWVTRIYAGVWIPRYKPSGYTDAIVCGKAEGGEIALGTLNLTGLPDDQSEKEATA